MKPPFSKSGDKRPGARDGTGKAPSGKTSYRPGGPRPSTPRPPAAKAAAVPREPRPEPRAEPKPVRMPDRPVLTVATKGAFGRDDAPVAPTGREARAYTPRRPERAPQSPADSGPAPTQSRPSPSRTFQPRPSQSRGSQARPALPGHDIDAPRGTIWLYGTHAIGAALQNPARRLRRLLLTEEAEAAMVAAFPKPWPIPVERTDRARLDQLLGRDMVHQGAALLADPLGSPSLAQALERPGPVLVLDQVSDPRNVGAILRSAAVFGAACVITQDRNAPDESGALAKAASGALERVPLLRAVNIARTLVALKAAGCWVVGLDASGAPLSGPALSQRRVALVLGSEGDGMRRLTRETCDELAGIPMTGGAGSAMSGGAGSAIDSLNVSAAGTVALYELSRKV